MGQATRSQAWHRLETNSIISHFSLLETKYIYSVMANTIVYISAAIAFILIVLLFLIAWIQSSAKQTRILASPTIPRGNAVLTSFASTRISAPTADVFAVLLKYKDYSKWSCFEQYKWQEIDEDGIPRVGSKGSFEVRFMASSIFLNFLVLSQCWKIMSSSSCDTRYGCGRKGY